MTTYAVTGATGQLGRLVVEELLATVAPESLIAIVRDADKATDLADRGVQVRVAAYGDRRALTQALQGVDRLLLISGSEVGQRVTQHQNVIDAARMAGVGRIVYTSATRATTSDLVLAPEHKATEEYLSSSGVTFTIARHNWYTENYVSTVQQASASGMVVSGAGEGRVASATRADFAAGDAALLLGEGHDNAVYELGGDESWNFHDLAAAVSEIAGREISYQPLSLEQLREGLQHNGLDEGTIGFLVALDSNIAAGALDGPTGELSRLIGRPTTPLVEGLRTALPAS